MSWWSRFFLTRGTNNIDTLSSLPGFKNIIHAKDDNDEVTGLDDSDKDDRLYGGRGNDILNGEGGDDRLYGGSGDDTLNGGTGDDQLRGDRGNDTLNGGWGEDYLAGGTGDDILNGGGDNDKLYGNSGDDTLNGDEGDDKLVGGSGDDTMSGGDDNDHLSGNSGDDVMNGDAGNDKIYGGSGDDEIDGGEDDDTISGGSGNDTILGGDGDDVIKGDHGNDTIDAGAGNDKVYAGSGNDTVTYNFEDNDGFENYLDGGSGKGDVLVFELDQMQLQELMDTGALEAFDETHPWRVFDFGDYVDIDLEVIGFEKLEFEILNAPPVAVDDENCITDEEEPVSGNILMNDSDPDMDMLTLNTVAAMDPTGGIMIVGLYGTLSIDETGAYTYDLDDDNTAVNALGVDDTLVETFSYEIQDIAMQTAVANLNITIKGINDPPDAVDDIECIDADAMPLEISVLMNDTDPDNDTLVVVDDMGDPLMIGVMQMGMFGDLEYTAGGVFTYTVEASAVVGLGVDEDVMESFTYYISDGNGGMDSASIEITIKGVNDQPTAVMDEICIALMDDTGMGNVLSNDTDPDTNDMLMVTNVNGTMVMGATMINGMYGTLTINEDGSYTYNIDETNSAVMMLMPGDDLTDTFSYDISDGNGGTSSSQLEVTLKNNNMPPTANRDMFTNNDAVLATAFLLGNIVSNDTEPDMQVLSVSNVSNVNITIPTFLDMFGDVTVGSLGISGDQIARFSLTPDMELANEVTLGGMEPPAILTIESDGDVFLTKNSAFDFIRDNMTDEIVITFDYTVSDPGGLTDDSDVTITLSPTDNNDTFFGLDGVADTLLGGAGSDVIRGFSGNDTLEGNAGDDIIDGGTGTDLARYNSMFPYDFVPSYVSGTQMANNVVFNFMDLNASDGDEGTDTIISIEQIVFGEGITYDVLLGDQGSQNFTNPLIGSSAVNDLIIGFEGNLDVIIGDVQDIAANTILASTSHDMIFGISNISSRLYGDAEDVFGQITTAGDDYFLLDNAGGKVVVGDVRGISLQANSMGDAVLVNAGDDRIISFASSGVNVYGDVETIRPLVILPHSVRLENAGDDFIDMNGIFGNDIAGDVNALFGGILVNGGDDTIFAGDGGDEVAGDVLVVSGDNVITEITNAGDDTINGEGGADSIYGDILEVREFFQEHIIDNAGHDTLSGGGGGDLIVGDIGEHNAVLNTAGNDRLYGNDGNDILIGDVQQLGGSGGGTNDGAVGVAGNDMLEGGAGDDDLTGDVSVIIGGSVATYGDDQFIFNFTTTPNIGADEIFDFSLNSDEDVLVFDGIGGTSDADLQMFIDNAGGSITDSGVGGDVTIDFGTNGSIVLHDIGTGGITSIALLEAAYAHNAIDVQS